jgi:hypothetical protein
MEQDSFSTPHTSLFTNELSAEELARINDAEAERARAALRASLLARAAQSDRDALIEAHDSGDRVIYDEVLNKLVERTENPKQLLALASYISRTDKLRVNASLANRVIDTWKESPETFQVAEVLHIAALSDNAETYTRAVETAFELFNQNRLANAEPDALQTLFESEYWVLTSNTRSTGAGFVLKQTLAECRRKLVNRES